jgi:hypothetical protein
MDSRFGAAPVTLSQLPSIFKLAAAHYLKPSIELLNQSHKDRPINVLIISKNTHPFKCGYILRMLFLKENALSQVQSMTGCHLLFSKLARLSPLGRLILISLVTQEVINIP